MPTATFFGATGGCALAALVKTLQAGITTTALVRTPSKLQNLLAERGVSAATISAHLRIVQGNAKDPAAVSQALQVSPNQLPDLIISGLGGTPQFRFNLFNPLTLDDPTVCADATAVIVAALRELRSAGATGRPLYAVVSTTGISTVGRDVPIALLPLYRLLAVPHEDKRNMEVILETTAAEAEAAPIRGFVIVRPTLLVDGEGKGLQMVRAGWEGGEAEGHGPALGYTIARNDVGAWLFDEIIQSDARDKWLGRMVTLTT